ncbi:MAG: DUF4271 domain-containing protein [Bacteroidales bacterium]|nr:DUF4271 domain-containing protein [Bacteroidales bacterium]
MPFQQEFTSDSVADTTGISFLPAPAIIVSGSSEKAGNYPLSPDLQRELTPDWVLYFILGFLMVLAWLRVIYTKFIVNIFRAAFDFQLAQKVFREAGIVQWRIFAFLNIFYYFSTGTFFYLVLNYFNFHLFGLTGLKLYGAVTGILFGYSLFRLITMKLTGFLFNREKLFNEAIFHNFIYNKISGMVLTLFILLLAYTRGIYQDITLYAGLTVVGGLLLRRFFRMAIFIHKSVVLLFYFILYLCSLEIIPVLVIIKLIFSLQEVT